MWRREQPYSQRDLHLNSNPTTSGKFLHLFESQRLENGPASNSYYLLRMVSKTDSVFFFMEPPT